MSRRGAEGRRRLLVRPSLRHWLLGRSLVVGCFVGWLLGPHCSACNEFRRMTPPFGTWRRSGDDPVIRGVRGVRGVRRKLCDVNEFRTQED